ncbi:MAG: DUF3471 domain-containing protein [Rhodopila sp.]
MEFYGLGWMFANTNISVNANPGLFRLYHSGDFSQGSSTTVFMLPEAGLGIVVLTNGQPKGVTQAIATQFLDLAQFGEIQELTRNHASEFAKAVTEAFTPDTTYAKPPSPQVDALPSSAYVGTYSSDYVGDIELVAKDGGLTLLVGSANAYPLTHFNCDTFSLSTNDIGVPIPSGVTFTIGADGKAATVRVDMVDTLGQGVFRRVNA